jgi:hypothetical protein
MTHIVIDESLKKITRHQCIEFDVVADLTYEEFADQKELVAIMKEEEQTIFERFLEEIGAITMVDVSFKR